MGDSFRRDSFDGAEAHMLGQGLDEGSAAAEEPRVSSDSLKPSNPWLGVSPPKYESKDGPVAQSASGTRISAGDVAVHRGA